MAQKSATMPNFQGIKPLPHYKVSKIENSVKEHFAIGVSFVPFQMEKQYMYICMILKQM